MKQRVAVGVVPAACAAVVAFYGQVMDQDLNSEVNVYSCCCTATSWLASRTLSTNPLTAFLAKVTLLVFSCCKDYEVTGDEKVAFDGAGVVLGGRSASDAVS
jgi:hypothetical protein